MSQPSSQKDQVEADSVGVVTPECAEFNEPFKMENGAMLPYFQLMYETYGELNADRTNAVLICHALSGHHHAAGYHDADDRRTLGWWDNCIGPGKPIDTNDFYVVALNNIGGCHGSTGPTSNNPEINEPYGSDFPQVTVGDWVNSQARFADYLGIESFAAVIGGSLGGMQAMQWAIDYPDRVRNALLIACAPNLSAQNIAFNEIARQAILKDRNFNEGRYLAAASKPMDGLGTARMLGHVTYLSADGMELKFGGDVKSDDAADYYDVVGEVTSYLQYNGQKFAGMFDANTYLLMTHALDQFDPARSFDNDLVEALKKATARFLVISFTTDWRFAPERSREIVDALISAGCDVSYADIESLSGHDSFLLEIPRYHRILTSYMKQISESLAT
ncbi:MAG: homoserine O-acetyltransferase [Gammaproteobacteria bacterium]|nr:homoserine O-acetyltransferase [Gammaproteobacteria bacterium]